jgi:hypothetical protein
MRTTKRTEITIETHRVLVVHRRGSLLEGWCDRCDKQVGMFRLEEAALAGISLQAIRRHLEAGRFHFAAGGGELSFICLNSLLEHI